jgi:perosamine synthetase
VSRAPLLPYGRQLIDDDDVAAVVGALRSDYLTTGPEVELFERELAAVGGSKHAVVVSSGTAALHCAYAAAGIGPDDEVITTPLTFSATANMVVALGARPRFVDVDSKTLCLDPRKVEAAIGPRTRALAPVDFAGHPAAMDELMEIARRRRIKLIEDAAHSLGGRYHGRRIGSLAHATVFSFHPVKAITSGEGGAALTDDDALAQAVRDFRNHGLVREPERLARVEGPWSCEIQSLGFNYRLSDLHCALGRSQLKKLPKFSKRRAELVARYRRTLSSEPRLRLLDDLPGCEPAWHLFAVRLADGAARARFFAGLRRQGILAQVHYLAVNEMPFYRRLGYNPTDTPVALEASQTLVSLPLFPAMTDEDLERVIRAVREVLDEA